MIPRRQLPVAAPLSAGALAAGAAALVTGRAPRDRVAARLLRDFAARAVALTDTGTSALVLALRIAAPAASVVAFPGYACVDLIAAARRAGVRMRLYDLDPATLAPEPHSLARVVRGGISAVVVAPLYGFPVDVPAVRAVVGDPAVPVIEDAAQQAGGTLRGVRAGAMGDLVVLSFGRGKGMSAGRGGALLSRDARFDAPVSRALASAHAGRGTGAWAGAAASWLLGRPTLYALPAAVPALHLGETVYHDAVEPAPMPAASVALLEHALDRAPGDVALRRANAARLDALAANSPRVTPVVPLPGAEPGYLRYPVLTRYDTPRMPQLGVVGAYPRPLAEQPEIAELLAGDDERLPGARDLARRLVTMPTHHLVTERDFRRFRRWLEGW